MSMMHAWLGAFMPWLGATMGRVPACVALWLAWVSTSCSSSTRRWMDEPFVMAALADLSRLPMVAGIRRSHVIQIILVRGLLVRWLQPRKGRGLAGMASPANFLLHLSGWALVLVPTRWQWRLGERRRSHARRRLVGMPGHMVELLTGTTGRGYKPVLRWLALQRALLSGRLEAEAVVYQFTGERWSYVGFSAHHHRLEGTSRLGLPDARAWQHMTDIATSRRGAGMQKFELFQREHPGAIAVFAVDAGSRVAMASLERALTRLTRPEANTTLATTRGWRFGQTEKEGPTLRRCRPPAGLRRRGAPPGAPLDHVIRRLPRAILQWTAREARRACARASRGLRESEFRAAYDAYRLTPAGSACGPICLWSPAAFDIAVSFVCTGSSVVDWPLLLRMGGREMLYRLALGILHMRRPGRCLLGQKKAG